MERRHRGGQRHRQHGQAAPPRPWPASTATSPSSSSGGACTPATTCSRTWRSRRHRRPTPRPRRDPRLLLRHDRRRQRHGLGAARRLGGGCSPSTRSSDDGSWPIRDCSRAPWRSCCGWTSPGAGPVAARRPARSSSTGPASRPASKVHLLYGSANRDEREFGPTADQLDVTRPVPPHALLRQRTPPLHRRRRRPAPGPRGARGAVGGAARVRRRPLTRVGWRPDRSSGGTSRCR